MKPFQAILPLAIFFIAILIARYNVVFGWSSDALLFFFILPMAVLLVLRHDAREYGLRHGDWKFGVVVTVVGVILSIIAVGVTAQLFPDVRSFYGSTAFTRVLIVETIIYMFAWEFLLRGYLLHGMTKHVGLHKANLVQAAVFTLAHIGKPLIEFVSTPFTGIVFGYLSYRSRSIYPMVVIHTAIYLSVVWFTK